MYCSGGSVVTALDGRDVTEPDHPAVDSNERVGKLPHVLDLPAGAHVYAIVGRCEESRGGHRVLRVYRIADLLRRETEFRQLRVLDLDVNTLLLVGDEIDLVDIRHPQELGAQALRVIMQLREGKPVALEGVDVGNRRRRTRR